MVGKWPGRDFASIPFYFVENRHGKHAEVIFVIFGFLEKSLEHRIPPKGSLVGPAAPELILGGPWCPPK